MRSLLDKPQINVIELHRSHRSDYSAMSVSAIDQEEVM